MFGDVIQASPLPSKRSSIYVPGEPSWECTPQCGSNHETVDRKGEKMDELLDSIEAPRFLDFEELIREEGVKREDVEFGENIL